MNAHDRENHPMTCLVSWPRLHNNLTYCEHITRKFKANYSTICYPSGIRKPDFYDFRARHLFHLSKLTTSSDRTVVATVIICDFSKYPSTLPDVRVNDLFKVWKNIS